MSRGRSSASIPKDKILELYLNQIPLGNRRLRRRGRVPAILREIGPRSQRGRGGDARRDPEGAHPLQPAPKSQSEHPAPQHGAESAAGQRPAEPRRTPSAGRRIRCSCPPTPTSAAWPSTSSSTCASSSRRDSARISTRSGYRIYTTPRSRHPAGGRAGAGGPARGHRERRRREVHPRDLPPVPWSRGADNADDDSRDHDAVSPGAGRDARGQDRLHPGDGGRARLRRQQVQSRHPGAPAAGLDLQADRVRGRGRGGLPAVPRDGGRPAQRDLDHHRAALGAAELRSRVRRPDDVAAGAVPVAQHHRHQARHGARASRRSISEASEIRAHHAGAAGSLDPHRLGRRDPARDDRGLYDVRQPRRAHRAQRHPPRGGPQRQDRLAAAGTERGRDGHARTRG